MITDKLYCFFCKHIPILNLMPVTCVKKVGTANKKLGKLLISQKKKKKTGNG